MPGLIALGVGSRLTASPFRYTVPAMTFVDRLLQRWRIAAARKHIPEGGRVLDVGCADGALFRSLENRIASGIGVEPDLEEAVDLGRFALVPGTFPAAVPAGETFDAITMLAVMEHVPADELSTWPAACRSLLRIGGRLVITVPSAAADRILLPLQKLRLIDGMSLDQHHGFSPDSIPAMVSIDGFKLVARRRFELGFNNLFVYERV